MTLNWASIQNSYQIDADAHWRACQSAGLSCPFDVFEQLFFDHHDDVDMAALLKHVDFARVGWEEADLSGVVWRRVTVPRVNQEAVDEARHRTFMEGLSDEREAVLVQWEQASTWLRVPVLISGEVLGSGVEYELLVGNTRVGNLLGLLDRMEVAEALRHRAWIGRLRDD
jgi:hypothetical protein